MTAPNLSFREWCIVFALTICAIFVMLGVLRLRSCFAEKEKPATVQIHLPEKKFSALGKDSTEIPRGVDSSVVKKLLAENNALKDKMRSLGVRSVFYVDTVLNHDTVRIECDETNKKIFFQEPERIVNVTVPCPDRPPENIPLISNAVYGGIQTDFTMRQALIGISTSLNITKNISLRGSLEGLQQDKNFSGNIRATIQYSF